MSFIVIGRYSRAGRNRKSKKWKSLARRRSRWPADAAVALTLAATSRAINSNVDSWRLGAFGSSINSTLRHSGLQFLQQHVERLGQTRLELVFALDDRFVHAGAAITSSDFTVRNSCSA